MNSVRSGMKQVARGGYPRLSMWYFMAESKLREVDTQNAVCLKQVAGGGTQYYCEDLFGKIY